jgi:hypothetical protein
MQSEKANWYERLGRAAEVQDASQQPNGLQPFGTPKIGAVARIAPSAAVIRVTLVESPGQVDLDGRIWLS